MSLKQMRENESYLMGSNWSSELKVACYELSQFQPFAKINDMRDCAQTMEDILASIQGGYKYGTNPKNNNIKTRRKTAA